MQGRQCDIHAFPVSQWQWRDINFEAVLLDSRASPQIVLRARTITKGELREEEREDNKDFPKWDRCQKVPGHFR